MKKTYIYGNSQVLAQHDEVGDLYFYMHDRLGSVRQIIDTAGAVVRNYTYTPFGKTLEAEGTLTNPFMFTGQWYDSEIAQYYLRARMYDPQLMRLTSIDPVFGRPDRSLTLHKYLYCLNDPANRVDLTGKMSFGELMMANAIAAEFRSMHSKFMGSVFHRAEGWTTSFSQMNLERGMRYDLLVNEIDNDFKGTMVDAGIEAVRLYSENAARWIGVIREVWEDRKEWLDEEEGIKDVEQFIEYSWNKFSQNYLGIDISMQDP